MAEELIDLPSKFEALVKASLFEVGSAIKLLQLCRLLKFRSPLLVIQKGTTLLKFHRQKLGDEYWALLEQVCMAAAEIKRDDWVAYCLKKLRIEFPNSLRLKRLVSQVYECSGKSADAKTINAELIEARGVEETVAPKRFALLEQMHGRNIEAAATLSDLLSTFGHDNELWSHFAAVYIQEFNLAKASWIFEEVLLSNPHSLYNILTYAELQFSVANFSVSRQYYSLVLLDIDSENPRALWGLLLCVQCERASSPGQALEKHLNDLSKMLLGKLTALYEGVQKSIKWRPSSVATIQELVKESLK